MNEVKQLDNEMKHYGVLGMKWGVRRDPKKAYARASEKLAKLHSKTKNRTEEYQVFYGKALRGGIMSRSYTRAANKANRRAHVAKSDEVLWRRRMERTFSAKKLSKLEQKSIAKGEAYLKKIRETSDKDKQKVLREKATQYKNKGKEFKDLREQIHGKG